MNPDETEIGDCPWCYEDGVVVLTSFDGSIMCPSCMLLSGQIAIMLTMELAKGMTVQQFHDMAVQATVAGHGVASRLMVMSIAHSVLTSCSLIEAQMAQTEEGAEGAGGIADMINSMNFGGDKEE